MFIDRLEGQTRGMCAQSVLCAGQVVSRMPHDLAGNGAEEGRKERDKKWCDIVKFNCVFQPRTTRFNLV